MSGCEAPEILHCEAHGEARYAANQRFSAACAERRDAPAPAASFWNATPRAVSFSTASPSKRDVGWRIGGCGEGCMVGRFPLYAQFRFPVRSGASSGPENGSVPVGSAHAVQRMQTAGVLCFRAGSASETEASFGERPPWGWARTARGFPPGRGARAGCQAKRGHAGGRGNRACLPERRSTSRSGGGLEARPS